MAEFERELILERTRAGIARAHALGKKFGAPRRIPESVAREVRERRAHGESFRMISQRMNLKLGGVRSVPRRDRYHSVGSHVDGAADSTEAALE